MKVLLIRLIVFLLIFLINHSDVAYIYCSWKYIHSLRALTDGAKRTRLFRPLYYRLCFNTHQTNLHYTDTRGKKTSGVPSQKTYLVHFPVLVPSHFISAAGSIMVHHALYKIS